MVQFIIGFLFPGSMLQIETKGLSRYSSSVLFVNYYLISDDFVLSLVYLCTCNSFILLKCL